MRSVLHGTSTTGCSSLDSLLGGGLPGDGVTLVYGEAETGKTSLAIQCAVYCARQGYKALFIDADGTFSTQRLSQIAYRDVEEIAPRIILMRPTTFREQLQIVEHLNAYVSTKFRLVVVDTVTSLYSVELGSPKETFRLNRELNQQVAALAELAKTKQVTALITSQVRTILFGRHPHIEPVATRSLQFWSDVVLNLRHTGQTGVLRAILEKPAQRKRAPSCFLTLGEIGISDYGR